MSGPRRYDSPKRDKAAEETRRRIIKAASEVLAGPKGFAGMSLEGVATAAGVTRLTIYNQFGTRRGLLEALFDDRAATGGLSAIPLAMILPDPTAAILRIAEIFAGFWASDTRGLSQVWAATVSDPELAEGIQARNERRRDILRVLVSRMTVKGEVPNERSHDLVDLLFALTSLSFYRELAVNERSGVHVEHIVRRAVEDALAPARRRDT